MRHRWSSFILLLALAASANAQITRTATFDNFTPGQFFNPSFTDPLSGVTFSNSTHPPSGGFAIDSDPAQAFLSSNYLTAGIGPSDGFAPSFCFTAALPSAASDVSMAVIFKDASSNVTLNGFNAAGTLVAQTSAASSPMPFELEIDASQYNISSFTVSVTGGFEAYDNIAYTILPEPTPISCLLPTIALLILRFRKSLESKSRHWTSRTIMQNQFTRAKVQFDYEASLEQFYSSAGIGRISQRANHANGDL